MPNHVGCGPRITGVGPGDQIDARACVVRTPERGSCDEARACREQRLGPVARGIGRGFFFDLIRDDLVTISGMIILRQ